MADKKDLNDPKKTTDDRNPPQTKHTSLSFADIDEIFAAKPGGPPPTSPSSPAPAPEKPAVKNPSQTIPEFESNQYAQTSQSQDDTLRKFTEAKPGQKIEKSLDLFSEIDEALSGSKVEVEQTEPFPDPQNDIKASAEKSDTNTFLGKSQDSLFLEDDPLLLNQDSPTDNTPPPTAPPPVDSQEPLVLDMPASPQTPEKETPASQEPPAQDQTAPSSHITNSQELQNYMDKSQYHLMKSEIGEILIKRPDDEAARQVATAARRGAPPERFSRALRPLKSFGLDQKKTVVIGGGIAALLLIVVLYFLFFSGGDEKSVSPVTDGSRQTTTAGQVPKKEKPPTQQSSQEDSYTTLMTQAKSELAAGNFDKARELARQAEKINSTAEIADFKKLITKKIQEKDNEALEQRLRGKVESEEAAYIKAMETNTFQAYESFLQEYPDGRYAQDAQKNIATLNGQRSIDVRNMIVNKTKTRQKTRLRADYVRLNQTAIDKTADQIKKLSNEFESKEIAGDKVVIDYATGLAWHFWDKPMSFDKAKLFSIRKYGTFIDWRLPTIEELASICRINLNYFGAIPQGLVEIWSGDIDYEDATMVWVLQFSAGTFKTYSNQELKYLCTVCPIK